MIYKNPNGDDAPFFVSLTAQCSRRRLRTRGWSALGHKGLPPGHGGRAGCRVSLSANQLMLLVEVTMDGAMHGDEFLQRPHAPEAKHWLLASPEWLVRV